MKNKDITFHYTNEEMVKDLLAITPIFPSDTGLDAGSGRNKVWFKHLPCLTKYECEIEEGHDFLLWQKKVDWVVGNPPFHIGWQFIEKAMEVANVGIAFLGNLNFFNSLTPKRIELIKQKGFYLQKIQVVADKRWFGRYYYLIFSKVENNFLNSFTKTY